MKKFLLIVLGIIIGFGLINQALSFHLPLAFHSQPKIVSPLAEKKNEIIGFLPYWLVNFTSNKNYSNYISTLTYFGLTINKEGQIIKLISDYEEEPGWHTLTSGKLDKIFLQAKKQGIKLSLLIFSAEQSIIDELITNPQINAQHLIDDVAPLMRQYGFNDLNLDIETIKEASSAAQTNFTIFVKEIKKQLKQQKLGTLTIDIIPTALIKPYLTDPKKLSDIVDYMVFMTYDYHHPNSYVTGPVAPLQGAGIESELDTEVAIKLALNTINSQKIIMGLPVYGYKWESLDDKPHSAVLPGSGITFSNRKAEEFLTSCNTCKKNIDYLAQEAYIIYQDETVKTYHQLFYPDQNSMTKKIQLAKQLKIKGVALWALGYEGKTILEPLKNYR